MEMVRCSSDVTLLVVSVISPNHKLYSYVVFVVIFVILIIVMCNKNKMCLLM